MDWVLVAVVAMVLALPSAYLLFWLAVEIRTFFRYCWRCWQRSRLLKRGFLPFDTFRQRQLDSQHRSK